MFDCKIGGIYSISFQKGTDQGYLDRINQGRKDLKRRFYYCGLRYGYLFLAGSNALHEYFLRSFLYFIVQKQLQYTEDGNRREVKGCIPLNVRPFSHTSR
jgi:hypothetical protein